MSNKSYSGFAQFPDAENREQFVHKVLDQNSALTKQAYVSGSQPTIVFENLTATQHALVIAELTGLGSWFEDVQFNSLE